MATWKIANYDKKNAVERQIWTRNGQTIIREEGYRWGYWTCESESKPEIDLKNDDGFQVISDTVDWEMEEMTDGCWADVTYPETMSEDEQEQWSQAWEEDYYDGVENLGWILDETEFWIYGPIELTNLDTGKTFLECE